MALNRSGLIREVALNRSGLIREVALNWSGLIRGDNCIITFFVFTKL